MDRRRLLVAAITVVGVLAVGIGTAAAATGMRPPADRWRCPVIYKADTIQASNAASASQNSTRITIEPWFMRRCHFPTTSSSTIVTPPSTPGTIVCIKAPCNPPKPTCPVNKYCVPELPRPTTTSTISVPRPPICPQYSSATDANAKIACPTCPPFRALDKTSVADVDADLRTPRLWCPLEQSDAITK